MKLPLAIAILSLAATVKGDRGSNFRRGTQEVKPDKVAPDVCGSDGVCAPRMRPRDFTALNSCLETAFPGGRESLVTLYHDGNGEKLVKKITDPRDGSDFDDATYQQYSLRWPAAVVYAADDDEVQGAILCATSAGYNVSAKCRGNQWQGLSNMDGHVVIDTSLLCNPSEFTLDRTEADWLLPGQKTLGSIFNGAGCTNAVMLAYTHKNFDAEEGAVYAIGTCPAVGITGYTTGGGSGDSTPYIGWGADDVLEVEMFLHDGTKVTANKDENADLFWAVQGGGSGLGVITSMRTAVIASPEPPEGETRKFCFVMMFYRTEDDDKRKKFLTAFQDFLYDDPDSVRFGGGGQFTEQNQMFHGLFLGSKEEFGAIFAKAGLLDTDMLNVNPSFYSSDYENVPTPAGMPEFGIRANEFNSYGEAMVYKICTTFTVQPVQSVIMTSTSGDLCADLGISSDKCFASEAFGEPIQLPNCQDPEVIGALVDAAYDPTSWFNRSGLARHLPDNQSSLGGLLVPRVDIDILNEIAKKGVPINHFQHGAAMAKKPNETALAHRDTAILLKPPSQAIYNEIAAILANKHYKDANKLQGYYNYMGSVGDKNWCHYYFGNNCRKLSEIKAKYDPINVFGNPMNVEPAVPESLSAGKPSKTWLSSN